MTDEQALAFWYGRINYEQRSPNPGDLKLDRTRILLRLLGNPQERLRIVHIAGTKGKGSTAAMLASVLMAAGYRTGLFTSPHLLSVHERIQVDSEPISQGELTGLLRHIEPVVAELDRHVDLAGATFFELATALGFLHFVHRRVEVAVVEVGLGGRFDSTNVCRPITSLITSISYDHTQQLGTKLASIAREKAGIVKKGVPVISGATTPEARAVIEQVCDEVRAPLACLERDFFVMADDGAIDADGIRPTRASVRTRTRSWPRLDLGLLGEHQAANAAIVVACVEELRRQGFVLPDEAVRTGLRNVRWPARLEIVGRHPVVVLDCAHNVASVQALIETLVRSFPPCRRLLLFAASSDKDLPRMCEVLAPHFAQAFLTRYRENPRAASPDYLAELLAWARGPRCSIHATSEHAWAAARNAARPSDLICITGSVFLAGELRPLFLRV